MTDTLERVVDNALRDFGKFLTENASPQSIQLMDTAVTHFLETRLYELPIRKVTPQTNTTDEKVNFFRYVRPIDPKTGLIDSSKGVCFFVVIDYHHRKVSVSASVCNGDNFSKTTSKQMAVARMTTGKYFKYELDEFMVMGHSVVDFLKGKLVHESDRTIAPAILKQLN